jgi:hypothetical protein
VAGSISKEALLKITGDSKSAEEALDRIDVRYDELKAKIKDDKLVPQLDKAKILAQAAVLREELKKELKVGGESAGDAAGQGFMAKFGSWLIGGQTSNGGGGIGGILSTVFSAGLPGIAALVTAIGAGIVELDGLLSGFAAAGAGIGAFGLLALPTIDKIKNGYTAISAAQTAYNTALAKEKLDPTKTNIGAVATALLNLKVAQQQAGPMVTQMIGNIGLLKTTFDKLAQAQQPMVLSVLTNLLGDVNEFLPNLGPMATAAGGALNKLSFQIGDFFASADFKKWLGSFDKLIGPSIGAIGAGIGKILPDVGKLFTLMSAKDVVHSINIAFDIIDGLLKGLALFISDAMLSWDKFSSAIATFSRRAQADLANWAQNTEDWINKVVTWFLGLPGRIVAALARLPGILFNAGASAVQRLIDGLMSKIGSLGSAAASLASKVAGFFGLSPAKEGPLSGSGAPEIRGQHFAESVASGMRSRLSNVATAAGSVAGAAGGGVRSGTGGGVVIQVGGGSGLDRLFAQWLRNNTRLLGGGGPNSVQIAWGQTH